MLHLATRLPHALVSAYGHPYNHEEEAFDTVHAKRPLLVSSVCVLMNWKAWDEIGYWIEPGGPGGSEDYDYSMRAKKLGYDLAVSNPNVFLHCGLTSSKGDKIVGYDLLMEKNRKLVEFHGLQGKVTYE